MTEKWIVGPAIRVDGVEYDAVPELGANVGHSELILLVSRKKDQIIEIPIDSKDRGWRTSDGRYATREEAFTIADTAGQVHSGDCRSRQERRLYSDHFTPRKKPNNSD